MLYFVYLRQPGHINDPRDDPFWEFGSFGQTGCHRTNLLHPSTSPLVTGDRLVFLQGSQGEIRMIGLTPAIEVKRGRQPLNVTWDRTYRPLPYVSAPVLIDNHGYTDFPAVTHHIENTNRTTNCAKAASRLRSRSLPIARDLEEQILKWFARDSLPTIAHYLEAINAVESRWVQHGLSAGWSSPHERALRYAEASGIFPETPEVSEAKATSTPGTCVSTTCQLKKSRVQCI